MKKVPRQRVKLRMHKAHKDGHKKTKAVVSMATKAGEAPRHARLGERTKGQSVVCLPELGKATKEPWPKFMSCMALVSTHRRKSRKPNQTGLPSRPHRCGNGFEPPERQPPFEVQRGGSHLHNAT